MRSFVFFVITATAFACSWDYPIWIPRSKSADALYRFVKDGKAGYIDVAGHIVIPPTLPAYGNYGSEFHDGLLEVGVSDGKYVDRTGKIVLDKHLYRGWDFSEGLAVAMKRREDLWGYIDTTGEFVISPRFATYPNGYVHAFSNGLAMIEVKGLFGFIDHSGAFVIPPLFLDASSFNDEMARVVVEGPCVYFPQGGCGFANPVYPGIKKENNFRSGNYPPCKFAYIDKTGRIVTPLRFDSARDFLESLAAVRINGSWGFIDKSGNIVIPPQFEDAGAFSSGLSKVRVKGFYGFINRTGKMIIAPQFKEADDFSDGLAVVGDHNDSYWYIDESGKQAFPGKFAVASAFFKGLAHVQLSPRGSASSVHAYIDRKGRQVFTY